MNVISEINEYTQELVALRLVGGFDSDRNHIPALSCFRFDNRIQYQDLATKSEDFCDESASALALIILDILKDVPDLVYEGVRYSFDIKTFTDKSMRYLLHHVIAQVNDE